MDVVWEAIGPLSLDLKMALLLRDVVGLSYAEISEALDTTLATVKWRIYKARETVVAELTRDGFHAGRGRHAPTAQAQYRPRPVAIRAGSAGRRP